jgi:2-keto-4-pentenoate hydratase/2-oxohepta-3-ene-1,7-dioic acid hydratase in catechol pathway
MKLVSFADHGIERPGVIVSGRVVRLDSVLDVLAARAPLDAMNAACAMARLLALDGPVLSAVRAEAARIEGSGELDRHPRLEEVALLAPVTRPGKVVAIGRNYADHAAETGSSAVEKPRIIAKLSSSVCGPGAVVSRPAGVQKLDFEVELAVVIGRSARNVTATDALAYVAGYTILDDVSAREFQFDVSPAQTTFAKSMDGFCPLGPWLVTAD